MAHVTKRRRRINIADLQIIICWDKTRKTGVAKLFVEGLDIGHCDFSIIFRPSELFVSEFEIADDDYRDKGYGSFLARSMIGLAKMYHVKYFSLTDVAKPDYFWTNLGLKRDQSGYSRLKL